MLKNVLQIVLDIFLKHFLGVANFLASEQLRQDLKFLVVIFVDSCPHLNYSYHGRSYIWGNGGGRLGCFQDS